MLTLRINISNVKTGLNLYYVKLINLLKTEIDKKWKLDHN